MAKFKTPKENRVQKSITPYIIIIGTILTIYAISLIVPLCYGFMITLKSNNDFIDSSYLSLPNLSYWTKVQVYNKDVASWLLSGTNLSGLEQLGELRTSDLMYFGHEHIFGNYIRFFNTAKINDTYSYYYGWNMKDINSITVDAGFLNLCFNTFLYAGVSAILTTMAPCIMGYLCAKFPSKFASFLYGFVIVVLTLPIVGTGAATLTFMKRIRLHDTFWGLWIRELTFMNTYFLIFFAFFKSLPNTYSEAAEIDGASYFRVMWMIYVPFALKMITTAFLILFVGKYNAYSINLIHLRSRPTLAYAAWKLMQETKFQWPVKLSACYVLSLPMLIFFVLFKNKLMGNMTVGGLKG